MADDFVQRRTYFDELAYFSDQKLLTQYQKDIGEASPNLVSRCQIIDALMTNKFGPIGSSATKDLKVWDVLNKDIYHEKGQQAMAALFDNIAAICKCLTPDQVRYLYSALDIYHDETFWIILQFAVAGKPESEVPIISAYKGWT